MSVPRLESLGVARDGEALIACTVEAPNGIRLRVLNLGGIVQSLHVPDAAGDLADVVLGFDDAADYLSNRFYLGAIVGRYANRIAGGAFPLDGATVQVTQNQGRNHLHGGTRGFDKVRWTMTPFAHAGVRGVVLEHTSPDGDEGFLGCLRTRVTYSLSDGGEWDVEFHAESDGPTPVNLTQHSYFNLSGAGTALDHRLRISAERYLKQTPEQIPTGEVALVAGTGFDLRRERTLRDAISEADVGAGGLDHSYVFGDSAGMLVKAAELFDPQSGRRLTVSTTAPSVHCYTARYLDQVTGKSGASYRPFDAVCLEAQHYPDAPNHPHFPSTIVRPGVPYHTLTRFTFSTRAPTHTPR